MQTLREAPPRRRVGVRRSMATAPRVDHRAEIAIAVAAILGALLTSSTPTGTWLFDLLQRGACIALLAAAATRARRWTLLVPSGFGAVLAAPLLAQLAALAALCLAAWNVLQSRRRRVVAATTMGLSAPALFLQGADPVHRLLSTRSGDPVGASLVLGVLAVAPMLWSAWSRLRRRDRARVRKAAGRGGLAIAAAIVVAVAAAALAASPAQSAIRSSRAAAEAAADGDVELARLELEEAANGWRSAHRRLNGPWLLPARAIPILGQHVTAASTGVRHAAEISAAAVQVADGADTQALVADGRVNTEMLGALVPTTAQLASAADRAHGAFAAAGSPWLIAPLGSALDVATVEMATVADATAAIAAAAESGHQLLASPTGSTIVVMFSTPAEARGAGGFIGNWAEFRAIDGRVELVEQYRSKQLNDVLIASGAQIMGNEPFVERYGRFAVEHHVQDVTLSPDFPSVAAVTADLYEQATGKQVDAVMMIDPFVLEALLAFSGPVDVDGLTLSGANASNELLRGQYERFAEDEAERTSLLDDLAAVVVERLLAEPPDVVSFAQEMAPLAEQNRVAVWFASDDGGGRASAMGVSGAFPTDGDDVLAVVHQNAAQNKIDSFLRRSVDVTTTLDVDSGMVRHGVQVELQNLAPAEGLPPAIIGSNDQGLPLGTNRMLLSVYSPFPISAASLDGRPVAVETQREFGRLVHTVLIDLPPNSSSALHFELAGFADLSDGYDVHLPLQPLVSTDEVRWAVHADGIQELPAGWSERSDGAVELEQPVQSSARFRFDLG